MQQNRGSSPIDRVLRLFADVRTGESGTVLLLALNLFLILTAYYCIKPVREALIGQWPEIKSYMSAGIALMLLGAVPLYGALANRMPRRRLINVVTIFFAACLGFFFIAFQAGLPLLVQGIVFFLWIGVFNMMVVAQLWSFANDIYTREEGERLFPIVMFGASFGAIAGSFISGGIIGWAGVYPPMLLAAALLMISLIATNYVDARERRRSEADLPNSLTTGAMPAASQEIPLDEVRKALTGELPVEDVRKTLTGEISVAEVRRALEEGVEPAEPPEDARAKLEETAQELDLAGVENPFRMVLRCRYLLMVALLMLFLNWVNTTGEYILTSVVNISAGEAVASGQAGGLSESEYIGSFWASFFGVVNTLALLLQLFFVSRVIKYVGVQIALLIVPLISLGAYAAIALVPVLAVVRWGKTAENATDYSLQNTVRNILFLPCTREQKYKAKQAIDTFFVRAGDVLQGVLVFVGINFLAMQARHFAAFNVVLVLIWLALAVAIGREYKRLVASGRPPCVQP
ncbi:MAG: MFS transporter [Gemmatimonadota bacterium]|nr:MAG: MFS transporter [Gemmatimonadota bacterium]